MSQAIQDIADLEERRRVAMVEADIAALDQMLAAQLAYTHSNAAVDNKADYLEKIANGYFDYRELIFTDMDIRLAGDAALVIGKMTGSVVIAGSERKLSGQTSVVWIKLDGRWQLLAFQGTPIPAI